MWWFAISCFPQSYVDSLQSSSLFPRWIQTISRHPWQTSSQWGLRVKVPPSISSQLVAPSTLISMLALATQVFPSLLPCSFLSPATLWPSPEGAWHWIINSNICTRNSRHCSNGCTPSSFYSKLKMANDTKPALALSTADISANPEVVKQSAMFNVTSVDSEMNTTN